jgi:hypothetical protein
MWLSTIAQPDEKARSDKRTGIYFTRKTLFGSKVSDEWHRQIDVAALFLRPSDNNFPWLLLRKHTDAYLKKKGKLSQSEVDIRLGLLIVRHEGREVAIAACAHAMTPASVRAVLNVQLSVVPATFYGLDMYLQSLIAANHGNPTSVTDIEAQWATRLLPYATPGASAAGRCLEGICDALRTTDVANMDMLPDFLVLTQRAIDTFALQLEGFTLKCQWVQAHSAVAWMSVIIQDSPTVTPPGHLLPEHLLDTQFPAWRIWSSWRPDVGRIKMLERLDNARRGVFPDMLALEGPDFITGQHPTLRDGLISQYDVTKPIVRFRGLIIEVASREKEELETLLRRTAAALDKAVEGGEGPFNLFVQLSIARPITQEGLQLIEALHNIDDTPEFHVHSAVLGLWTARPAIDGRHISELSCLLPALGQAQAEALRNTILRPWLIQGIETCLRQCQEAIRTHIATGLKWTHLALEYRAFCLVVKDSVHCLPLLDYEIQRQLDVLPSGLVLRTVLEIYEAAGGEKIADTVPGRNALKEAVEAFCIDRLIKRDTLSLSCRRTVDAILHVWRSTESSERRTLAILASKNAGVDFVLRCRCLAEVTQLPDELVKELVAVLDHTDTDSAKNCVMFTELLAKSENVDAVDCWNGILQNMLEEAFDTLKSYAINHMKLMEFYTWMMQLNTIFGDVISNPKPLPSIIQPALLSWTRELFVSVPAITRLERILGDKSMALLLCVLESRDELMRKRFLRILDAFATVQEEPVEKLLDAITAQLSSDGRNISDVSDCISAILSASETGVEACQHILESVRDKAIPPIVKEVSVAGWLESDDDCVTENDKSAIKAIALLYAIETYENGLPVEKLIDALDYYGEQEASIIQEADRIESIKTALKARDPIGTAILLEKIGYPDVSPLDEELAALPAGIVDAVEKRAENQVEISFPLTDFTDLQRAAAGIGDAKTLLVRLFVHHSTDMPLAFCIHLDGDYQVQESITHTPWIRFHGSAAPSKLYCHGKPTPLTFHLSRVLHRHGKIIKEVGIAGVHDLMKRWISEYARYCIICGATHSATTTLRRPMPCLLTACTYLWSTVSLDLRIPELRTDPFAVDMLLTSVYAAAQSGHTTDLLPKCPIRNASTITAILNTLPPLSSLKHAVNLSATLKGCHPDAEELLVWACTHFRGLVASASGLCRIPNLPTGTHQFVLANACPALETTFASRISPRANPQTRVLFHGTSLDRLPSILASGLKIYSGTALQRTGAAHGKGIYMAEDPVTSMSYSPSCVSWRNSGLNGMRLLLGCEVIGDGNRVGKASHIHVIRDERCVLVRYVFLFPGAVSVPAAGGIVPAMGSAIAALRSGAV